MRNRSALGRGLDKLIPETVEEVRIAEEPTAEEEVQSSVLELKISAVEPNREQPRRNFETEPLDRLAESIRLHGVIQPILVNETENGMYQIVAGERRWRAARLAGLNTIPAVIKTYDEKEQAEVALIENLQREDLNPLEESEGYQRLMQRFGFTQEDISDRVGKSRSAVANALRLLNLDDTVRNMVETGTLSAGHARALLAVHDLPERIRLAERIVTEGLSVRQAELLAKEPKAEKPAKKTARKTDPVIAAMERKLTGALGTKVSINAKKDKGKIEIEYYNLEQMNSIIEKIL